MAGGTRSRAAAASIIKSIQRGQTTVNTNSIGTVTSSNVTINAVDLSKSFVSVSFKNGMGGGNYLNNDTYYGFTTTSIALGGYLSSTTQITLAQGVWRRYNSTQFHSGGTCYWEVVEYE